MKTVADVPENRARFLEHAHASGDVAGVMKGCPQMIVPFRIQFQFFMMNQVSRKFCNVYHFGCGGIAEPCSCNRRNRHFKKISRAVHSVHILMHHTPHVPALTTEYPFHTKPFCFVIHLGVQLLHHIVRGEHAEVSAFRSISAYRIIKTNMLEE